MDVIDQGKLYMAGADCFGGIEELRMRQEIGEHGVLEATVWLLPDQDCREDSLIWQDLPVSLRASDGEEHSYLFSGLVRKAAFCRIQGRPAVKLRALSHTVKLDGQKKDRSYQRESRTYGELVRTVLAPYQGAAIWNGGGGEEKTGAFLMQYRETDWEFLRRVASRQKKPVVAEVRFPAARIHIGMPAGGDPVTLAPGRWHIRKSLAKAWSMGDNEDMGRRSPGMEVMAEGCYEDLQPGDAVEWMGRRLVVAGKESCLEHSQLIHSYRLRPEQGCLVEPLGNGRLSGAAVRGRVLETTRGASRLSLDTDGEGEQQESLHTQTVYYAGGGKGYSGQPEPGDIQYLYFPTDREEDRYILGCVGAGEDRIAELAKEEAADSARAANSAREAALRSGGTAEPEESGAAMQPGAGEDAPAAPENLPRTKTWSTPGKRRLSLQETGIVLAEGSRSRIEVMDTGITVSSGGNLELQGGRLFAGHAGKLELAAKRYLWLRSGESGLLLMPDQLQMSAGDLRLGSYQSKPRIVLDEDSVEEILLRYEAAKASVPQLVASDGSIVRREGYDDILRDDFLYTYFLTEVCDQDPKYMRTHDQPYVTLYEQWLDDTYGKTELGKMWEYLSTIDGIQALLDVGGFIFDGCDLINCVIYLCRGKYEDAIWSAVCALPLWGSLIGKGGRKVVSLAGGLAEASQTMKLASEGSQVIRKLSLVLEVPAGLVLDFDKAMSHFADQLRAAMMAPEYNRLYMAGIEYVNDVEIFYRMTDGAVDGMQSAWRLESGLIEGAADVWKVPEEAADARKLAGESGRVAEDVVEGGSPSVENKNITGMDWYEYFRETYGKENVCWENCNPSEVAAAWQGSYPYVGVDTYKNTILHDGEIIWMGEPFPTGYSTTSEAIADLGNDAQKIFGGLQVKPYYENGMSYAEYRSSLTPYKVHGELNVAEGLAVNNPQFGVGGLEQRFDPNFDYNYANGFLERLDGQAIELTNTKVSLEDYFNMMDGIK